MLSVAGAGLGLAGSLVGIVQWHRSTVRANPTGAERLALGGVLGAVALAVLLSLALTLTGRTAVAAEAEAKAGATANGTAFRTQA